MDRNSADDSDFVYEEQEHKSKIPIEDVTSKVVGDFGRWQLWISVFMSLLKLCGAWYQLNIIFMAPPQDFWCVKPPRLHMYAEEEWRKICAPKLEEYPCLIFDPDMLGIASDLDRSIIPLVACTNFTYDTSVFKRTMTSDWDLVCDRKWMIHVTQCAMMTGVLLGGVFFGMLADKYGRRTPLMWAITIQAVASFTASLMPYYWMFFPVWFILALASGGITIISFVLCMEAVSGKWRTIIPVLYQLPFGLGNTVMAVLAYYLRDWRKLEVGLAILSSLYILYWFWIPESPRWLIAQGQTEKAVDELYRASQQNKSDWTKEEIRRLMPKPKTKHPDPPTFGDFLSYPVMRLKTILLASDWLLTGLAFYTFSQYLGGIGGNIFITVAYTGAISASGPIVCVFVVSQTGRKVTIWIFQLLRAICFVITWILPKDDSDTDWPRITCAGIGFAAMAASVPTMYLYTGELFPTLGRNRGVGAVTMFARVGSMMAPFIVMLDGVKEDLPLIILAASSFGQMFLLVPLPETKNQPLPDTIEQAEQFVKEKKKRQDKIEPRNYHPLPRTVTSIEKDNSCVAQKKKKHYKTETRNHNPLLKTITCTEKIRNQQIQHPPPKSMIGTEQDIDNRKEKVSTGTSCSCEPLLCSKRNTNLILRASVECQAEIEPMIFEEDTKETKHQQSHSSSKTGSKETVH